MKSIVCAIIPAVALASCGSNSGSPAPAASPTPEIVRTCDSIRTEVVRLAASHGVEIVKIYDPKDVKIETKKISCSGRAMVSSGKEVIIYYRDYQDEDGDWIIQYAEERLD